MKVELLNEDKVLKIILWDNAKRGLTIKEILGEFRNDKIEYIGSMLDEEQNYEYSEVLKIGDIFYGLYLWVNHVNQGVLNSVVFLRAIDKVKLTPLSVYRFYIKRVQCYSLEEETKYIRFKDLESAIEYLGKTGYYNPEDFRHNIDEEFLNIYIELGHEKSSFIIRYLAPNSSFLSVECLTGISKREIKYVGNKVDIKEDGLEIKDIVELEGELYVFESASMHQGYVSAKFVKLVKERLEPLYSYPYKVALSCSGVSITHRFKSLKEAKEYYSFIPKNLLDYYTINIS